jgi:biopolymer transport protein ExbD
MADIDTSGGGGHGKKEGHKRSKKLSTRVDLTPMVDLAFLLISFFMLTTSLSKPVAMDLAMPKKDVKEKQDVKESKVLNIIADKDDKIWYYEGLHVAGLKTTNYSASGLRQVILNKQKKVNALHGLDKKGDTQIIVLVKLADDANYKNMVDILDEIDITKTKIYAIQDLSEIEKEAIANGGVVKSFASTDGSEAK